MNQVKEDEFFVHTLEDEASEVEHLLAEPKNDNVSVDGVLCFGEENLKCLEIEGGLDSTSTREGEDELKLGVFDEMLHEVDEMDLHATNGLSCACEDYLLDIEFAERVYELDNGPHEGSCLGNSSAESHSPGFIGSDNGVVEIFESSTETIPVPECQNDLLDKTTICELHGALRSKCGCETQVNDKMWLKCPTSFDLQNLDKLENVSNLFARGISSNENEKDMIFTPGLTSGGIFRTSIKVQYNKVSPVGQGIERESLARWDVSTKGSAEVCKIGSLFTEKRLRKPTRRYIEELSDLKSRYFKGRQKASTTTLKDKILGVRSRNKHHHMGFIAMVPGEQSFGGASIQAPIEFREKDGSSKKPGSISGFDSDEEPSLAKSEDHCVTTIGSEKGGGRRKHHRLWTLSEVIKLIDGVSQCGVGRWTDIKRLLFSSSAYRTSVDLKDKWRNLLRASCAQLQNKKEVEQKQKHALHPLPKSVLRRVSELAIVYPYPRERNSKLSRIGHVTCPILSDSSKGAAFSLGKRIVARKNCT